MLIRCVCILSIMLAFAAAKTSPVHGADRIVLRDLSIISNRTVQKFDVDGVHLDDGSLVNWGEIERANVGEARQEAFNALLKKMGPPLLRLRQRLKTGDYVGLLESAESLYPSYQQSDTATAYLVFQSLMWGRLADGQRAQAVAPYLRCYDYLVLHKNENIDLPGNRRLEFDPATGLCADLPPVWFDAEKAKKALPDVLSAVQKMKSNRPDGVYLYYASLLVSAGNAAQAVPFLQQVRGPSPVALELRTILNAQAEAVAGKWGANLGALEGGVDSMSPQTRPLGLYWLGMARLKSEKNDERQQALLQLLHVPALFGDENPELAAAALYAAMNTLSDREDLTGSLALRREIQTHYSQTYHAALLKRATSKAEAPSAP